MNERYTRSPYAPWPADGSLPDAGVVVHCFDGQETNFRANRARLSGSVIFADQTFRNGAVVHGPGAFVFGHACAAKGGIVMRPAVAKVNCGNDIDCGNCAAGGCAGNPRGYCPAVVPGAAVHECDAGKSWHVADIHAYLRAATEKFQRSGGWPHYNEFEIDGPAMDDGLPWSIEAFLTGAGKGAAHAEAVHAAYLKEYGLTAAEVPLVTVTPNPHCLFVAGTKFESEGDPTRTCNAEHDHVSCGRCPYPGR